MNNDCTSNDSTIEEQEPTALEAFRYFVSLKNVCNSQISLAASLLNFCKCLMSFSNSSIKQSACALGTDFHNYL